MSEARTTTDHGETCRWAEERGGRPSHVKRTDGKGDPGMPRIDFNEPDEALEEISWERFFKAFEDNELALQDKTADGKPSRFDKLVSRKNKKD